MVRSIELLTNPGDHDNAERMETLDLKPGDRLAWIGTATRAPDRKDTSALSYRLWYRVETERGERGWINAIRPSTRESGSDGRPSMVELVLLPAIEATGE